MKGAGLLLLASAAAASQLTDAILSLTGNTLCDYDAPPLGAPTGAPGGRLLLHRRVAT